MVEERLLSSESWRQSHQVDFPEVTMSTAGSEGKQTLHVVPSDAECRVMELTITHLGTEFTMIQLVDNSTVMVSILCPPQSTRVWSSQLGRKFGTGDIDVQSSSVTGGDTLVSGSGLEV